MEQGRAAQLEYILGHVSIGVAIVDATSLRIRYANPYLLSLLDEPWCYQGVVGRHVEEVVPPEVSQVALPLLQQVATTGEHLQYAEVPYEGVLEARGRTYWRISIERSSSSGTSSAPSDGPPRIGGQAGAERRRGEEPKGARPYSDIDSSRDTVPFPAEEQQPLLITIEDVTESVRSRLHLNAIHNISSAIAEASALPLVLDRILQALQEMVGSHRCAIFLLDSPMPDPEMRFSGYEEPQRSGPRTATIAAHKNVHPSSQDWHPLVNDRTLLGHVIQDHHTLVIPDTTSIPTIILPFLDDHGIPRRPGSVLCVPIFEPHTPTTRYAPLPVGGTVGKAHRTDTVLGTIEVYHRRARGFPEEEIKLLERFAQQAGLAIQNARLFRSIDRWARVASRNAHQKENVMQAIPDGVVIYDPRWRVADANHAARKLFGWSDDVVGKSIIQAMEQSGATFLPGETVFRLPRPIEELERRALQGLVNEFKMLSADGQPYTLRCSYTPIRDDLGDIFAFIVIYHDVTSEAAARERIEAEVIARTAELAQRNEALQQAKEALEMASARLQLLVERLPSGVLLVSAGDNDVMLINRQAVQHLQSMGLPLEPYDNLDEAAQNLIGTNGDALLRGLTLYSTSGSIVPFEEHPFYRALSKGEASEAELHTAESRGPVLHFLFNAAPLRAPDSTIMSVILVIHEITASKTLERAREDFFTTMAHELKTPLANIRAHLSALLARDMQWSNDEQMHFLQTADEQVERLVGMVNYFLDASRVEAGALRLELEPILLPEMIEDLQERLEALITSSNRKFEVTMPDGLPAVVGDYELIMSVLSNLLSNAFRYAPEGDTVRLEVEPVFNGGPKGRSAHNGSDSGHNPTGVTLRVIDHGPGMSEEQQMVLFTRFSTFAAMRRPAVDRPGQPSLEKRRGFSRWSPATGLGLYISKGIIEAHGSKLQLQSSPGQGATFAFILPVFVGK
ncbi:MAG TPA: PAS domain-containing protein [Ktedonosporobacter sp.]|nr:PAS domain-containing protein [Ktedonosporobacter sp.]